MQADIAVFRLFEETGAGNRADSNFLRQNFREFQIGLISELRNINQNVLCALRNRVGKTNCVQPTQKQVPLMSVFFLQVFVVIVTEL